MLNKISSYDSSNISFRMKGMNPQKVSYISSSTFSKVSTMRSVVKEILLGAENISTAFKDVLKNIQNVRITPSGITILQENRDGLRFVMPRGVNDRIFKLQIIKDEKPSETIILENEKLVKELGRNTVQYAQMNEDELKKVEAVIEGIYSSSDSALFQLRMLIRNSSKAQISEPPKSIEISKVEVKPADKPKIVYPAAKVASDKSFPLFTYNINQPKTEQGHKPRPYTRREKLKPKNETVGKIEPIKKRVIKPEKLDINEVKPEKFDVTEVKPEVFDKISKIYDLYQEILSMGLEYSRITLWKIREGHGGFKTYKNGIKFNNGIVINIPKRKEFPDKKFIEITDTSNGEALYVMDNKLLEKSLFRLQKPPVIMNAESVYEKLNSNRIQKLIEKATNNLTELENYINNKLWHKVKSKETDSVLDSNIMDKIEQVRKKFAKAQEKLKLINIKNLPKIKEEFTDINFKRTREALIFTKAAPNGDDLLFGISSNRLGDFVRIIQIRDDKVMEAFLVNKDGRVVKNYNKSSVLTIFSGAYRKLFYYSDTEAKKMGLNKRLDSILNILDEKMTKWDEYLVAPKTLSKAQKISVNEVKVFFDEAMAKIQQRTKELVPIEDILNELKKSFNELIEKHMKKKNN